MSKNLKKKVPELRFPEFEGNWETDRIDQFLVRYVDPVGVQLETKYKQIGIRSHGKGIFHKDSVTGKELGNKRVFWVHPRAFVVNIVFAWEQAVALTSSEEEGFIASHRFLMFLPKKNKANLEFILLFFLRRRGKNLLEIASPGGAGRNKTLGQQSFAELEITLPQEAEQEKIASFLGAIANRLTQLRRKQELLQTYKRGVMQKLFSQQIRFKQGDGQPFPDWKVSKINSLGSVFNGLTGKSAEDFGEGKPYVTYKQVFDSPYIKIKHCRKVLIKQNEKQNILITGDILFTTSSETPHEVGFASVILEDFGELYLNSFCFALRIKHKQLMPEFSMYLFRSPIYRKKVSILAQGSTRYNISKTSFLKLELPIPCLEEQEKIADFLTAIDQKIEAVAQQIELTEQYKKGLLQKMFV